MKNILLKIVLPFLLMVFPVNGYPNPNSPTINTGLKSNVANLSPTNQRAYSEENTAEPTIHSSGVIQSIETDIVNLVSQEDYEKGNKNHIERFLIVSNTRFLDPKLDDVAVETFKEGDKIKIDFKEYTKFIVRLQKDTDTKALSKPKNIDAMKHLNTNNNKSLKNNDGVYSN